jgi:hypothetical protein
MLKVFSVAGSFCSESYFPTAPRITQAAQTSNPVHPLSEKEKAPPRGSAFFMSGG